MPKLRSFQGFLELKENYFRFPNEWFDFWIFVRAQVGPRFVVLLKMMEYVLLHTWGMSKFEGKVRLSANEIHSGRRKNKKERWDSGVGISENAVRKAGDVLVKLGVLTVNKDTKDKARQMRTYQPKLRKDDKQDYGDILSSGFSNPEENYFKVPKAWINVVRNISSAAVILAVEYLMRHAWGYQNSEGVWLTAEEVANGRKYANGSRYDNGTGFALATIQRALKEAGKLGLVAWQDSFKNGIITRRYNLRFEGMKTDDDGELIQETKDTTEDVRDANDPVLQNANEEVSDVIEEANGVNDDVDDVVEAVQQNAIEEVSDVIEETNDVIEDVNDANEERSLKDTPLDTHSRHFAETPSSSQFSGQSEQASADVEHNKKRVNKASADLPPEALDALREIGWADKMLEVEKLFQDTPHLVRAWLDYAKRIPQSEVKKTRAALFRHGIRTGILPPETPDYDDYLDGDNHSETDESHAPSLFPLNEHAQKTWQTVLGQLQMEMSRANYDTWLRDTQPLELEGSTLIIGTKDDYTREVCESRLSSKISRLLIGILNTADTGVKFVVTE